MNQPPDPEDGAGNPLTPDDPPTPEGAQTGQAHPSAPEQPNLLSEKIEYMASGVPQALGERLQAALEHVLGAPRDLILFARVDPITVRASKRPDAMAARLELPEVVPDLLGGEIETRVLADGERLRVWLAGIKQIEPNSRVTLIAITPGGEITHITVIPDVAEETIELSLPWNGAQVPEALTLAFERLRKTKGARSPSSDDLPDARNSSAVT